jgi:hypothetical protein
MKKYILLFCGVLFLILNIYVINRPFNKVVSHFEKFGQPTKATVTSKFTEKTEIKGRYNTSSERIKYKLHVTYESKFFHREMAGDLDGYKLDGMDLNIEELIDGPMERLEFINTFVSESEWEDLKEGDQVDILYLKQENREENMPDVILKSTAESSWFKKFMVLMKGDLKEHTLGIIMLPISFLAILIGVVFALKRREKI